MTYRPLIFSFSLVMLGLSAVSPLWAVRTQSAQQSTFEHFADGELDNIAVTSEGNLHLAPALETVAEIPGPVIWAMVRDQQGQFFVGTGNRGIVYRVDTEGEVHTYFNPPEILTRALALDADDNLYVGTSPRGKIYRIAPGGRPEIYFTPDAEYVWDMVFDEEGRLLIATGNPGKVMRLAADYQSDDDAETLYSTDLNHVNRLALSADGSLYAATGPSARLVRISPEDDSAEILYQGDVAEITGMLPQEDGSVYFSTYQGRSSSSGSRRSGTLNEVINQVRSDQTPGDNKSEGNNASRGFIYRYTPDGFVEPLWTPPGSSNVFSLAAYLNGTGWLVGTDQDGLLFSVDDTVQWSLLQKLPKGGEVSLLRDYTVDGTPTQFLATSNPAVIYQLGPNLASEGQYTVKAFDAGQIARWGRLRALALSSGDGNLRFETRTGNTPEPGDAWSDWEPLAETRTVVSPVARFFQYRMTLDDAAAGLQHIQLFYQFRNAAPVVSSINIMPIAIEVFTPPVPPRQVDLKTLTEGSGDGSNLSPPQPRQQLRPTGEPGFVSAGWRAVDPNGDRLVYRLVLLNDGETEGVVLVEDLEAPLFSFNTRGFTEGYYRLRVEASDKLDNPPGEARTGYLISQPFLVDNTPPVITQLSTDSTGGVYRISLKASDGFSVIETARYTLNGKPMRSALPDNGLFDDTTLTFSLTFEDLSTGAHSLIFEAIDAAGNIGVYKHTFKLP
jgi:sugar lactone lactonase YvrE